MTIAAVVTLLLQWSLLAWSINVTDVMNTLVARMGAYAFLCAVKIGFSYGKHGKVMQQASSTSNKASSLEAGKKLAMEEGSLKGDS